MEERMTEALLRFSTVLLFSKHERRRKNCKTTCHFLKVFIESSFYGCWSASTLHMSLS